MLDEKLLRLVEENARLRVFFDLLATRVELTREKNRSYVDVDDIEPLIKAFRNQNAEIEPITFDKTETED